MFFVVVACIAVLAGGFVEIECEWSEKSTHFEKECQMRCEIVFL